jgi:hypothetical protein
MRQNGAVESSQLSGNLLHVVECVWRGVVETVEDQVGDVACIIILLGARVEVVDG